MSQPQDFDMGALVETDEDQTPPTRSTQVSVQKDQNEADGGPE